MASITPISIAYSDLSALGPGALLPVLVSTNILLDRHLPSIDTNLRRFTDQFMTLLTTISVVENGQLRMLGTSLRVYETNPDVLDHLQAARWAVAYMSYVQMVELLQILYGLRYRLGQVNAKLDVIDQDLTGIAFEITALGNCICSALQEILALLRSGLKFTGELTIKIDAGGLGDILKGLDLGKLWQLLAIAALGVLLLVVALAALAAFVYALGLALATFTGTSLLAAVAVALLVKQLTELAVALSKMSWKDIVWMTIGLAALAGFVYVLALAMKQMSAEVVNAMPKLGEFINSLKDLAVALGAMSWKDVVAMTFALAALAGFVYVLGLAMKQMSAEVVNAMPKLGEFINSLKDLAVALGAMSWKDVAGMTFALAALAGFVYVLGLAMQQMSAEVVNAMPKLGEFINTLKDLAVALGAMSWKDVAAMTFALAALAGFVYVLGLALNQMNAETLNAIPGLSSFINTLKDLALALAGISAWDLLGMGVALALLVGFVYFLGQALNSFSAEALAALPAFDQLISSLNSLVVTVSGLDAGSLLSMGIAFALIAGFLYLMAGALDLATPGLLALAAVLSELNGLVASVSSSIAGLSAAISAIPSPNISLSGLTGGLLPSTGSIHIPFLQGGGVVSETGLAVVHAGEQVLPADQTQGLAGMLSPAGGGGGAGGGADYSVHLEGVSINIQAGNVDAGSAQQLSDEIIRQLQEKLGALRAEQEFRTGTRVSAPA